MKISRISPYEFPEKFNINEIKKSPKNNFFNVLKEQVYKVNNDQIVADQSIKNFVTGKNTDISDVVSKVEKANISLKLMVAIKNKIIKAYEEINKLNV